MADVRLVMHPLFSDADAESIDRALDQMTLRKRELLEGETFMMQGEEYDALALLVAGSLTATIENMSGRSLLIETLDAPEILAAPVLYSDRPRIPVTLTSASPATLFSIPRAELDRFCVRFPSVYRRLLSDSGEKFVFLSTKLRLIQFSSLRHKIAGYLLSLAREQHGLRPAPGSDAGDEGAASVTVRLPYSRERLAELFGVARPSLSRTLGEMVREGLVEVEGSHVSIRSVTGIRAVLTE